MEANIKMEERRILFDNDLQIEAFHFKGVMQKFPSHFHEYYLLGCMEGGRRLLTCKNKKHTTKKGDLLLFNPLESHACEPMDDKGFHWEAFNIKPDVMRHMTSQITGKDHLPVFTSTVVCHSDIAPALHSLHGMIMHERKDLGKEEAFCFLIERLITNYTVLSVETSVPVSIKIQAACDYMEKNYTEAIALAHLSQISSLNKYTLLRSFTIQKGITPYQYLSTIRVNKAKKLLEDGASPLEAALQSGFSDQSHFTRFFKNFIGLTPKLYQDMFQERYTWTKKI